MSWRARDFSGRPDYSAHFRSDITEELRSGRGFVLLRGLPTDGVSIERFVTEVSALGRRFGHLLSQNAQGELIGHVLDATSSEPTPRLFRSSLELRPHTDHAAIVLLACWNAAESGGETILASASTVHDEIRRRRPELLACLYRGFHCHRRGEQGPDQEPVTPYRVPVFSARDGMLSCRYQRAVIAAGHRELGHALSQSEIWALDLFDEIATAPENQVRFSLERGDVLVLNNYTVLHARTRFIEHRDVARRRHLIRIWLERGGLRHVPLEFRLFPSAEGIPPQPGRSCSYDFEKLYREDPVGSGGMPHL